MKLENSIKTIEAYDLLSDGNKSTLSLEIPDNFFSYYKSGIPREINYYTYKKNISSDRVKQDIKEVLEDDLEYRKFLGKEIKSLRKSSAFLGLGFSGIGAIPPAIFAEFPINFIIPLMGTMLGITAGAAFYETRKNYLTQFLDIRICPLDVNVFSNYEISEIKNNKDLLKLYKEKLK